MNTYTKTIKNISSAIIISAIASKSVLADNSLSKKNEVELSKVNGMYIKEGSKAIYVSDQYPHAVVDAVETDKYDSKKLYLSKSEGIAYYLNDLEGWRVMLPKKLGTSKKPIFLIKPIKVEDSIENNNKRASLMKNYFCNFLDAPAGIAISVTTLPFPKVHRFDFKGFDGFSDGQAKYSINTSVLNPVSLKKASVESKNGIDVVEVIGSAVNVKYHYRFTYDNNKDTGIYSMRNGANFKVACIVDVKQMGQLEFESEDAKNLRVAR